MQSVAHPASQRTYGSEDSRPAGRRRQQLEDWVWAAIKATPIGLAPQAVLWALARHADWGTGETRVGFETVAAEIHVKCGQVRRHVKVLVAAGLVERVDRPGQTSLLRLRIHPALSTTPRENAGGQRVEPLAKTRGGGRENAGGPLAKTRPDLSKGLSYEPAPRCDVCDERHNVGARCKLSARAQAGGGQVAALDAIRERWEWTQ